MTGNQVVTSPKVSLNRRLSGAFALVVGLIVLTGVGSVVAISVALASTDRVSDRLQPAQDENRAVLLAMTEVQSGVRGYLLTGDDGFLDSYRRGRESWRTHSARLGRLGDAGVSALTEHQRSLGARWLRRYAVPVVAVSSRSGDWERARSMRDNEGARRLFDRFRTANAAVDRRLGHEVEDARAHSFAVRRLVLIMLLVASALSAILGGLAAVRTTRSLVRPLARLRSTVQRLTADDDAARADVTQGPVEVRAVAEAINALADEGRRLRHEELEQARNRRLAHDVGLRIRERIEIATVGAAAVEELGTAFGVDRVYLRQVEDGRLGPVVHQWNEYDVGCLDGPELAALVADDSAELAHQLWHDAESQVVHDLAAALDAAPDPSLDVLSRHTGARAVLMTPFGAGQELLGTLTLVQLRHPRRWSDSETAAIQSIAADLGRAHQHASLYSQQQMLVEQLRALDRAKTDFLSTVSHELRTPLTSIAGYVELLRDGDAGRVTEDQTRMLTVIERNAERLRALIEDLLTISRIESGTFRTDMTPVDLETLIRGAAVAIRPGAAAASLTMEVAAEPARVLGDAGQLDRVLLNLLSNAVKFTPAGGAVHVRAVTGDTDVVISVEDTGIGIPADELGQLFSRFFRATNATSLAIQGTGLGLTIVRSIVERHHGSVQVRSVVGEGTTVEVRLPLHTGPLVVGAEPGTSRGTGAVVG